jgi:hypothetical protein
MRGALVISTFFCRFSWFECELPFMCVSPEHIFFKFYPDTMIFVSRATWYPHQKKSAADRSPEPRTAARIIPSVQTPRAGKGDQACRFIVCDPDTFRE